MRREKIHFEQLISFEIGSIVCFDLFTKKKENKVCFVLVLTEEFRVKLLFDFFSVVVVSFKVDSRFGS